VDFATLKTLDIITVSQIFERYLTGAIDKTISPDILALLTQCPALQHKLTIFTRPFRYMPFTDKYASPRTNLVELMNLDKNLSRRYSLKGQELLDTSIGVAPAYHTRIRDEIAMRPDQCTFNPTPYYDSQLLDPKPAKQPSKY
jgi:hypothetical protein